MSSTASEIQLKGHVHLEHIRNGEVIGVYDFPNGVVNEGKNRLLDVMFDSGTQITSWYLGLIDNTGVTLAADDIYDDINQAGNAWDEFTDYTDAANADSALTRPLWTPGEPASQSITNGTPVVFDITGTGTLHGLFLAGGTGADTKGNHASTGVLWATAPFTGGNVPVADSDQIRATYTVSA